MARSRYRTRSAGFDPREMDIMQGMNPLQFKRYRALLELLQMMQMEQMAKGKALPPNAYHNVRATGTENFLQSPEGRGLSPEKRDRVRGQLWRTAPMQGGGAPQPYFPAGDFDATVRANKNWMRGMQDRWALDQITGSTRGVPSAQGLHATNVFQKAPPPIGMGPSQGPQLDPYDQRTQDIWRSFSPPVPTREQDTLRSMEAADERFGEPVAVEPELEQFLALLDMTGGY